MRKFYLLALVLPFAAASVSANVIYNFQFTSPPPGFVGTSGGQLVVTDAAYTSGGASFAFSNQGNTCTSGLTLGSLSSPCLGANSPVVSFSFLNHDYRLQASPGDSRSIASSFSGDIGVYSLGFSGATVAGSIWSSNNNQNSGATMTGSANLGWTTSFYAAGIANCTSPQCSYAGRWVLDQSTIPTGSVPVPGTLALGGLALLFLGRKFNTPSSTFAKRSNSKSFR
jgi:hypothetical protein